MVKARKLTLLLCEKRAEKTQQSITLSNDQKLIKLVIESTAKIENYMLPGSRSTYLHKKLNSTYVKFVDDYKFFMRYNCNDE